MALSIKNDRADELARQIARRTGESLTDVVINSLEERLDRLHRSDVSDLCARVHRLAEEAASMAVLDDRPPDAIIGYDDAGLPG